MCILCYLKSVHWTRNVCLSTKIECLFNLNLRHNEIALKNLSTFSEVKSMLSSPITQNNRNSICFELHLVIFVMLREQSVSRRSIEIISVASRETTQWLGKRFWLELKFNSRKFCLNIKLIYPSNTISSAQIQQRNEMLWNVCINLPNKYFTVS